MKPRWMKWAAHVARKEEERNLYRVLVETEWEGVKMMYLVQDRDKCQAVVNTVMNTQIL